VKVLILILVLVVGGILAVRFFDTPGRRPSAVSDGGSGDTKLTDKDSKEARACLERELGDWLVGKESRVIPILKNPDGKHVRDPALSNYDIKFFRLTNSGDMFESGVVVHLKSQAGTPIEKTLHYFIRQDSKEPSGWDIASPTAE
jgi:hypothetical protein